MLKFSYENMDAVPENLKGAYVAENGRAVLDKLSDDHPKMVENKTVIKEKDTAEANLNSARGEITKLQNAKTLLENKAIPDGFIAIKAEEAPILEKIKALNIPLEEIPELKTKVEKYEQKEAAEAALNVRKAAGKSLEYNEDAFAKLAKDVPVMQEGDKFFIGEDKKPLTKEFIEAHDDFKPFLSSLTGKAVPGNAGDPPVHGNGSEPSAEAKARAASDFKSMF